MSSLRNWKVPTHRLHDVDGGGDEVKNVITHTAQLLFGHKLRICWSFALGWQKYDSINTHTHMQTSHVHTHTHTHTSTPPPHTHTHTRHCTMVKNCRKTHRRIVCKGTLPHYELHHQVPPFQLQVTMVSHSNHHLGEHLDLSTSEHDN